MFLVRRSILVCAVFSAGLLLWACGDDSTTKLDTGVIKIDKGTVQEDQGFKYDTGPIPDGPVFPEDLPTIDSPPPQEGSVTDTSTPTACDPTCFNQEPYLCVKDTAGDCVECNTDADCQNNPGALGNTCSGSICECTTDADCAGKWHGTKCSGGICACAADSDCTGPWTNCWGSLFGETVCAKPCGSDADCPTSAPKCDSSTGKCVACMADADCTSTSAPKCDTTAGKCVGCLADADCTSTGAPYCDTTNQACVECTGNAHCADSFDGVICDTANGICGCAADTDCAANTVWGPKCTSFEPYPGLTIKLCRCDADTDCASNVHGPTCESNYKICTCANDTECTTSPYSQCSKLAAQYTFLHCQEGCTTDADCDADTGLPKCDNSKCVECLADADCTDATNKYCVTVAGNKSCVACKADADCKGVTAMCDTATGACVQCKANTDCTTSINGGLCDQGVCTCKADTDCTGASAWGPKCDTTNYGRCSCAANTDCASNANGPTCYTQYNKCSCGADTECTTAPFSSCLVPYAGATYKHCQEACTTSADCAADPEGELACDTASGGCVTCLTNADCGLYGSIWPYVCDTSAMDCVECLTNSDCTTKSLGNTCDTSNNWCVCASDADCATNENGMKCDTSQQLCNCLTDADCQTGTTCSGSTSSFKYCK